MKYKKFFSVSVLLAALVMGCSTTEIDDFEDTVLSKSISSDAVTFSLAIKELSSSTVTLHSEITVSNDHKVTLKGIVYSDEVTEPTCESENTTVRKVLSRSEKTVHILILPQGSATMTANTWI